MAQEAEEILSNADIVTLTEAGLSPSAIVAVIESSGTDFDISVTEQAALAGAGVDSAVIEAMARASVSGRSGAALGQDIDFGDDTGEWANDGECDDPRFAGPAAFGLLINEGPFRDATDCRQLFESGEVWLADDEETEEAQEPSGGACEIPGFGTDQLASFVDLNLSWCQLPSGMFHMLRAHAIQAEGYRCSLLSSRSIPPSDAAQVRANIATLCRRIEGLRTMTTADRPENCLCPENFGQ